MSWATESLNMFAGNIQLRSLHESDFPTIAEAIHDPEGWSGRVWGIDTPEKIHEMLRLQIEARERGECNPLVYFVGKEVAGITRYLHISAAGKRLEVGGTCVAPKWRRTFVNTEVKRLMLTHAFENLKAVRVELRVDCQNYISQMNVLRLGAKWEGKIRHWQVRKGGHTPDGMLYSITHTEWPAVQKRFDCLRDRSPPPAEFLPLCGETPRLAIRLYKLADAADLLSLALRNHKSLVDSFPQIGNLTTIDEARAYVAEKAHWAANGEAFYYGVWDHNTHQQIGGLHLKKLNWKTRQAELGYFLDGDFRRQGLAREMVQWALDELLERKNFRRVYVRAITGNEASIGLAQSLGFEKEGILRNEHLTGGGEWVDAVLLSAVRRAAFLRC